MSSAKVGAALLLLTAAGSSAANAASFGITLTLEVPVLCVVSPGSEISAATQPGAFELGSIREYCNAPHGYELVARYTPGTLRGMTLIAGEERIVLNGSGSAVIGSTAGPAIKTRNLEAIPGPGGFDADHLDFNAVPKLI